MPPFLCFFPDLIYCILIGEPQSVANPSLLCQIVLEPDVRFPNPMLANSNLISPL